MNDIPGLRLTVVGCSGSFPGPDSPASSYLLEASGPGSLGGRDTWRILLDLGNGALGALQRYVDPLTIDGVFLSHLHADHCLDLCGYHVLRKYYPAGPRPRIPVWGPEGTAVRMARAYDLPEEPGMHGEFDFRGYPDDGTAIEFGPFVITPIPVYHPVPAYALRVTAGGRTLTYTGDTAWGDRVVRAAHRADLLLAEAAFRDGDDNPPGIHLTGGEAGRLAAEAGVGRLVVTHVPPWYSRNEAVSAASTQFTGPISAAAPGQRYEV